MKDVDATIESSYHVKDSESMISAADQVKHILDAKYEWANLNKVVKECQELMADEQAALKTLL